MESVEGEQHIMAALTRGEYAVTALHEGHQPFVTISHQTGAGGHSLAEASMHAMAREPDQKLFGGWQVFDYRLCQMMLEDPKLKVSLQSLLREEYYSEVEELVRDMVSDESPQDMVIHHMLRAIRTLAAFGKVIIVGRGGSFVTRVLPLGVHARLVKTFFLKDINDPLQYDAIWNTSTTPLDAIAQSGVAMIRAKQLHDAGIR